MGKLNSKSPGPDGSDLMEFASVDIQISIEHIIESMILANDADESAYT